MNIQICNQIEKEVLAILLVDQNKMKDTVLDSRVFLDKMNRRAYQIMNKFYKEHKVLHFESMSQLSNDPVEFLNYLTDLINHYTSSAQFDFLLGKLEENYHEYQLYTISKEFVDDKIEFVDAMKEIKKIEQESLNKTSKKLEAQDIYDLITSTSEQLKFLTFHNFQLKVELLKNTMSVIAARPQIGKTAFALNLANDLAKTYRVLYFNMEMTEKEIYQRLVSIEACRGIRPERLESDESERKIIQEATKQIASRNFKLFNGSKSYTSIRSIVARNQREEHCVVFIDHIGYVTTGKQGQSDTERIGECVREIQLMTKDLDVTVFLLCHINRQGSDNPTINDLKDSGELEQSAHVVMILHNENDDLLEVSPTIQCAIAKNRSGKRGKINFEFTKTSQRFKMFSR